jgi:hypothetical protein
MTPDQLVEAIPRAFRDTDPALAATEAMAAGTALREQYRHCVDVFDQIVAAIGTQKGRDGAVMSPDINLGPYNHPRFGAVTCSANIRLTPHNPGTGNERRTPYSVDTTFIGVTKEGRRESLGHEKFGANGFNFHGIRPPAFVRVPYSRIDTPWDQNESDRYDYDGGEYPWDMDNYFEVRKRLLPMIERATDTQAMLIEALQNPSWNPQLSERASGLTVVQHPTFTV